MKNDKIKNHALQILSFLSALYCIFFIVITIVTVPNAILSYDYTCNSRQRRVEVVFPARTVACYLMKVVDE